MWERIEGKRAVLFDLDDTLNDRKLSWRRFIALLTRESALLSDSSIEEAVALVIAADRDGYRAKDELFAELCRELPWKKTLDPSQLEIIWRKHFPRCTVERNGASRTLRVLRDRGFRLSIVSNGRVDMQLAKIEAMGISQLVDAMTISEAVGVKKPDPRIYIAAMESLGVTAAESIFVGDQPVLDVAAPRELGMKTVWLDTGRRWPAELEPADYVIRELEELLSIVLPPG